MKIVTSLSFQGQCREAFEFCDDESPANEDALDVREAVAATIRQRWRERIQRSKGL